jgi:hypothetical protein
MENWKGFWKQAVMAYSRFYSGIYLDTLNKITKILRAACVPVEIQTRHLQNRNLNHYHYVSLLCKFPFAGVFFNSDVLFRNQDPLRLIKQLFQLGNYAVSSE